ncbi:MAG: DUF5615 family PIN-like protein [Pyrinomonadaceae bacterium]|nr:DUF5615 family PIN-like protein [Sphingobacteriaceae bacterium]
MIIADENIDFEIIKAIRNQKIEVYSIAESNFGITDSEVISLSLNPPRIILTADKDFGEWVYAHDIKDISVILLRYDHQETTEMTFILVGLLTTRISDLVNKFTTITTKKIRIRNLL